MKKKNLSIDALSIVWIVTFILWACGKVPYGALTWIIPCAVDFILKILPIAITAYEFHE